MARPAIWRGRSTRDLLIAARILDCAPAQHPESALLMLDSFRTAFFPLWTNIEGMPESTIASIVTDTILGPWNSGLR